MPKSFIILLTLILKTARSSKISALKALKANNNEVVKSTDGGKTNETDKIPTKSKNIKKLFWLISSGYCLGTTWG